jgi:hypothetical protein
VCSSDLKISLDYKPTDFVVNALQHTDVQCTWDEGEKERENKLTNISQWRQLNESDFQQYIASSDSDSDDGNDRAKNIRKLLIGNDGEVSDADEDDFFTKADDDDDDEGEEVILFISILILSLILILLRATWSIHMYQAWARNCFKGKKKLKKRPLLRLLVENI